MRRRQARLVYVFLIFGIMAVILSGIANRSNMGGDWDTVTTAYIGAIPYLAVMGIGFYFALTQRSGFIGTSLLFGMIGVVNAGLFNHLNTAGIWFDRFVDATTTITDYMTITIIVYLIFGFLLGAKRR